VCGITGLISRHPIETDELQSIRRSTEILRHRGPDGAGEYVSDHAMLSMRRLSIIDLQTGAQPLFNEDRSLVLVANGEIYNYLELRKQLISKGHSFRSGSDCETIIHLYEEFDLDFVHHLRGMFAFALWDEARRRLVVARDRMGEKPLYIHERDGKLFFASELKALIASGIVPFELDPKAIDLFFHYQFVPEPQTPVAGVRKLEAGHLLIIEPDPWRVDERTYWRMLDAPPLAGDPARLIREELETISEIVIRSDVPVGVALSGGLDSSAIAALTTRKYPGTMHAFSVGYPGRPHNDERADAEELSHSLGLPFHQIELETQQLVQFFPELVYGSDDPIADISGFGYYAVSRLAREHKVPVMLQGQGGDELFWGYPWVKQALIQSMQKNSTRGKNLSALPSYLDLGLPQNLSRAELSQWARALGGVRPAWQNFQYHRASPPDRMVFYDYFPDFREAVRDVRGLYAEQFSAALSDNGPHELFTFPPPWPRVDLIMTRLICDTYLRENGISQGDRLSMASSIELRLPLVDYRLVEVVIGLRKAQPDTDQPPKNWLKSALKDVLPDAVINRPKRGFAPPVLEWHQALFAAYGNSLTDGYLVDSGVLTGAGARFLAAGSFPPSTISAPLSFKALVLEQWCRQMLKHASAN